VGATEEKFSFDNERPRHEVTLAPFSLASRPVSAGEYLEFMDDGGYQNPRHWLADGWDLVRRENWCAPLYWELAGVEWRMMTLEGMRDVDPHEPVCHLSYFEADAYATWAECRLPTEFEWEHATRAENLRGNFLESDTLHPRAAKRSTDEESLMQTFGDVWEWTSTPYAAYPGYQPYSRELGEYNGKFMVNQLVLRGGSCATPETHVRRTYRNFYYPNQRWMFSGLRLAR
jgi:ergothioneine biosynthesis protein EgtB